MTSREITEAIGGLRVRHTQTLARMPQAEVVAALAEWARRWRDPANAFRRTAASWDDPFPWAMVQVSLDALLDSLTADELWVLINAEDVRDAAGYPVVGHVIAGNTPLLAWVSVIRALLVRSASFVKLPSGPAAAWGHIFWQSLAEVSAVLAASIQLAEWPGGTAEWDSALCTSVDLVLAQGSDQTMRELKIACSSETPFVGYGHRVSFGVAACGGATDEAAHGFARDVLLYDQGGCLSAQTIYVEGDWNDALQFAERLAAALAAASAAYPLPKRAACAAMTVQSTRGLAWMEEGTRLWEDAGLRWTVAARPRSTFAVSPTFGVVSVQPLASLLGLPEALGSVADYLQGCAVAGEVWGYLPGVPRLCGPGELQRPPLGWRQDGRDVLRVLVPPHD